MAVDLQTLVLQEHPICPLAFPYGTLEMLEERARGTRDPPGTSTGGETSCLVLPGAGCKGISKQGCTPGSSPSPASWNWSGPSSTCAKWSVLGSAMWSKPVP